MPVVELPPIANLQEQEPLTRTPAPAPRALRQQHQDLNFTLQRKLLDKINLDALASIETQKLRNEVRSALTALVDAEQTLRSAIERNQIVSEVLDEVFGLGPLEPLLHDPTVSDILVNTHKQVYIERGGKLELTNVSFKDDAHLFRIIDKIVSQVGRRVDESSPMVDARLADGSRVNAIIPPLGRGWAPAVDSPLPNRRPHARGPRGTAIDDSGDDAAARVGREKPAEYCGGRRDWLGQDYAIECPFRPHFA